MARQIVTQALVSEAAEALTLEGAEPSIVAVQQRVGGGSYSTVKRYLDLWRQQRAEVLTAAPPTPPEVEARGLAFARAVWALAAQEAQREAQQAKEEAAAEVAAVRGELVGAGTEIARLEALEAEQAATVERQAQRIREVELALAEVQAQARRVPELEQSLNDTRAALDAARRETQAQAVEAGKLTGEAEALRAQVRDLMAALGKPAKTKA